MPTAPFPNTPSAGTKRKSLPASVQASKKPRIDLKSALKSTKPILKVQTEEESDESSDSDDSDFEGGAQLNDGSEEVNDEESNVKADNGIHPERVKAGVANSQSSKESHAKQKQLANERKAAKPLADQLARTKKIWERLRRKSHVPLEERKQLVAELFEIITGHVKDFVLKHDSVRVVQTAIKYANKEQKRTIALELAGSYRQLAESKYAKFLIGKLLIQGDDEIRDIIVPEFFGHVRRLIKHPEASWILDDVYRGVATKQQKAIILREWYGAEFALFKKSNALQTTGDLSEILAEDPGKRAPFMRALQELINQLIQKKMTGFTLLHDAMLQYLLNTRPGTEEIADYIELIKGDEEGDLLKNLAFTKSGSRLVSLILAYGTAKDRKHILKTYKDTIQMMTADPHGHIVILTAYEVIDDTVLTAKSIFPELLSKDADKQAENIIFSVNDLHARLALLYNFQGRSKALFPPSHSTDLEILAEIDIVRQTTSKKDPEIRRTELAKALSPYLLKAIAISARDLISTPHGSLFVSEVLFRADGDKSAALAAVAEATRGDPTYVKLMAEDGTQGIGHIGATPHGGKMLKALISGGRFDIVTKTIIPVVPALNFPDILYPNIKDYVVEWATGESSFVILALLESDAFSMKAELQTALRDSKERLQKAVNEETSDQKARREASTRGDDKDRKKKNKRARPMKEVLVGNKGSAFILAKL